MIEPTTSGWLRNSDNMLEPLWFEGPHFPETLKKSSRQNKSTKPSERKMTAQREARPQRFSSLVEKYALQDLSSDTSDSNYSDSADEYSTYESADQYSTYESADEYSTYESADQYSTYESADEYSTYESADEYSTYESESFGSESDSDDADING